MRRFAPWRRVAFGLQALVWLGLPFLEVGGESALRFDLPSLRLHFFGTSLVISELFLVLLAVLAAVSLFLFATVLLGRVWCGWACPQTVLGELTSFVVPPRREARAWRLARWAGVALVSAAVAACLLCYLVTPQELFGRAWRGELGPVLGGSWAVMGLVVFGDLAFLRYRFCAGACPYAMLQGALFDRHTLTIAYDTGRDADCVECKACVRVCPVGIDIRDGADPQCVSCTQCIDACAPVMRRLGRANLVGYAFGTPGAPLRLARPSVLALGALTLVATAGLGWAAAHRASFDLAVVASPEFSPRRSASGQVVNAYLLSVENRRDGPLTLKLVGRHPEGEVELRPAELTLEPLEHRQLRLLALGEAALKPGSLELEVSIQAQAETVTRRIRFEVPPRALPAPRGAR